MNKLSYYLKKYWYAYAFALLCTIIAVVLDMVSPQVTKNIIDKVIIEGKTDLLFSLLSMILFIGLGRAVFTYVKELIFDTVSSKIGSQLRKRLFTHIQGLSISFFDENNTGELMSRVKDDVDRIWAATGYVSMLIFEVTIHTGIALFFMYRESASLAIIPTIVLPIVGGLAILMENKLGKIYENISEQNAKLNTVAQENLAGVRTVKAFAREKFEINKFLSHNKQYYDLNMKQSKVFIKLYPYFQLITKLLPMFVILFGGRQVIRGEISLGTLGAFTEYSMNIVWPMEMLGWLSNDLAAAFASYKRIRKIFAEEAKITEPENPVILDEVKGSVEFNQVSFNLNGNDILTDISFKLEAGKTIGIMGTTGAGKSSIINLLQRFYDASQGEILLDGVNIKDLSLKQLRGSISLVMQDVFLFSDTINENVKLGKRPWVKQEEVIEAAHYSQASEFIERMDDGYDTIIGERGVGLSGGQKQRISIARALAKKTPILVLDDSTSALDMETEHLIQKSLTDIKATKIIIAHRISAVRNADEIIILENGKIKERGTHETLLKEKGYYYQTYQAQYGDYISDSGNREVTTCL
ncbi:ABC transporter ATP-binding protein [Herbinix luporum]|jgi:ATP-binding cassette subfamily B protein|uniref:Putative membrane protein n=1 Tax=Herbinix luporum TaxID=1679721 RepID=A0A0K8J1Q5_9FIRM|nr:ABC transporter ATP-binding protein [Herbinix luporum]CUH91591.1 putative membrane protein [Herbinix luporum]HHT56399.1 ABC transporter ATP-binding protein [Herbinix luporum]